MLNFCIVLYRARVAGDRSTVDKWI